eukprot:5590160-Prymnesium_polylepis.1
MKCACEPSGIHTSWRTRVRRGAPTREARRARTHLRETAPRIFITHGARARPSKSYSAVVATFEAGSSSALSSYRGALALCRSIRDARSRTASVEGGRRALLCECFVT